MSADRVAVMYLGRIVELGRPRTSTAARGTRTRARCWTPVRAGEPLPDRGGDPRRTAVAARPAQRCRFAPAARGPPIAARPSRPRSRHRVASHLSACHTRWKAPRTLSRRGPVPVRRPRRGANVCAGAGVPPHVRASAKHRATHRPLRKPPCQPLARDAGCSHAWKLSTRSSALEPIGLPEQRLGQRLAQAARCSETNRFWPAEQETATGAGGPRPRPGTA